MSSIDRAPVIGAEKDKELLKDAKSFVYSLPDGHELLAHFFTPDNAVGELPAIAFFHGGFWDNGSPTQFIPQCLHFAQRGMIAVTFEYRTKGKHDASPEASVADIQKAILMLKQNSQHFSVDPERIIAAGAGAGAYAALCSAMLPSVIADESYDARPSAVIGLSSIVNTTRKGIGTDLFADRSLAKEWSPSANVRKDLPPILLMHGLADRTSPFPLIAHFVKAMKRKKNNCELVEFEGADHSFFNFNVSKTRFDLAIATADRFVSNLGYIEPEEPFFRV